MGSNREINKKAEDAVHNYDDQLDKRPAIKNEQKMSGKLSSKIDIRKVKEENRDKLMFFLTID